MSTHITPRPGDIPLANLYKLLQPITIPPSSSRAKFRNWGLSFECTPLSVFEPENEFQCELILELARREGKTVRAAGVGHSPNDLACTNEFMLRTRKLNRVIEANFEKRYVVVQAGITLQDLHQELAKYNLAMMNLGSISDQSLAGIITTATHGSGISFGVMSTHVLGLTMLLADGSRVSCSRVERPDLFKATLCGLGCTGLILNVQLEVEPAFRLREVQESLPFDVVLQRLDEFVHSSEHTRFWWFPTTDMVRVSFCDRTKEPKNPTGSWWWHTLLGHHFIQLLLFFGIYFPILNTWTANFACWLVSSKSVGVDDSHVIYNVDCRYPQETTEWAIPYENTQACLRDLRNWLKREQKDPNGLRPHFPVEIRFSAPDDIWLSPSYGQQTCWIGIVQFKPYGFNAPYRRLFSEFMNILSSHGGRPHWAKVHQFKPHDFKAQYPHFDDFVNLVHQIDPRGLFSNEYIQRHIFGRPVDPRCFKARKE